MKIEIFSRVFRFSLGTITGLAFAPSGDLYIIEEMSSGAYRVLELTPSNQIKPLAGATIEDCGCSSIVNCNCGREKVPISSRILLKGASDVTVTPDGIIHISDQKALRVYSLSHYLPTDDQNGDYQVIKTTAHLEKVRCRNVCIMHSD